MEITNLACAEFKTLVIRMLRELTEYGNHIKEEVKVTVSDIKKNPQGTDSEGKEAGIQTNNLEHEEEMNNNQTKKKKQEFKTTRAV